MEEYHKCNNCGLITYGGVGYFEMMKHTNKCKKSSDGGGIICLFTTYRGE